MTRKAFSKEPLRETNGNARKRPRIDKKPRLVQTQIDLGGKLHKTCRSCGMQYVPSNAEDAALHKKFHVKHKNGIAVSRAFMDATRSRKLAEIGERQHVISISRSDPKVLRSQAQEVLEVANTELGSISLDEELLWGQHIVEDRIQRHRYPDYASETEEKLDQDPKSGRSEGECDRFKVYLLLRDKNCVGLCLAETISKANKVVEPDEKMTVPQEPQAKSSSISISKHTDPALLGISRIWTSTGHRNEGVATALLDCVAANFLYGLTIPKNQIAFSQPTESGGRLARKWFGAEYGWHVYVD